MESSSLKKISLSSPSTTMSMDDLPPRNTVRWVAARKAAVVKAVSSGLISLADACDRYQLSEEEFSSWQSALSNNGLSALKVTQLKRYRA